MTVHIPRPLIFTTLVALAWLGPSAGSIAVAHASPEAASKARALFQTARALMAEGDFEGACPLLSESLEIERGIGTQFNLAHCWEHQGKAASAHALFLEVAAEAESEGQPERAAVARRRAHALEASISYVVIEVAEELPQMIVRLDGTPTSSRSWGVPIPVNPGEHEIVAEAEGYTQFTATIYVRPATSSTELVVPPLAPQTSKPPANEVHELVALEHGVVPPEATEGWGWRSWALVASAAVVVSGAALGVTSTINANTARQEANRICPNASRGCEAWEVRALAQQQDAFETWRTRSIIGFGAAAIGAATFATVFLWDESPAGESPGTGRLSVALDAEGVTTHLELQF